jgi:hypothetical protein
MKKAYYYQKPEVQYTYEDLPPIDQTPSGGATESSNRSGIVTTLGGGDDPDFSETKLNLSDDMLLEELLNLADSFDNAGLHEAADFSDFLIKKFAQVKNIKPPVSEKDYVALFNDIVMNVNNSDTEDKHNKILKMTRFFCGKVIQYANRGVSLEASKEKAYNETKRALTA